MQACDRTGWFRAIILDYGLKKMDSGAVAVAIHVKLTEMWDDEKWIPWGEYDMEAFGDVWIVKKDGKLNDRQAKALMEFAGWDASLESITNGTWETTPCQVQIDNEKYKNQDLFKISWINDFDKVPGAAMSNVDDSALKELAARFGSPLRALQSNVKRNSQPPSKSRPSPPPRPATVNAGAADDDIAF